jgi:hypothetical protein
VAIMDSAGVAPHRAISCGVVVGQSGMHSVLGLLGGGPPEVWTRGALCEFAAPPAWWCRVLFVLWGVYPIPCHVPVVRVSTTPTEDRFVDQASALGPEQGHWLVFPLTVLLFNMPAGRLR